MSSISKPNVFSASTTISSSEVNDNFDTIYNDYNGNISSVNLADNAVTTAKITDSNVTTAKIADDAVTYAKTNMSYNPYGRLTFSTYSTSGGQVINGNSAFAFDTFTTNNGSKVTNVGSGVMKLEDAGVYILTLNTQPVAGSGVYSVRVEYSLDNSAWNRASTLNDEVSYTVNQGCNAVGIITVPANSYVRAFASTSSNIRFAADDADSTYECALSVVRIA